MKKWKFVQLPAVVALIVFKLIMISLVQMLQTLILKQSRSVKILFVTGFAKTVPNGTKIEIQFIA